MILLAVGFEGDKPMIQCEYTKPHPKHHRWVGGKVEPGNCQQCEGVKDPDPPDGFDYDEYTSHPMFSKQSLGEFELWKMEQEVSTASHPVGEKHIHFLYLRGNWEWVVRSSKSPLCNTPRCRLVRIEDSRRM